MPADQISGFPRQTPNMPQGRIQRRLPTPFARARIDLGGEAPKHRDWRQVPVVDLQPGDTVPGIGLVSRVVRNFDIDADMPWIVVVEGGDENVKSYPGNDIVYAFTADST